MRWFDVIGLILTISAFFSFLNYKFFKLPKTVGLMIISLGSAFCLMGLEMMGIGSTVKLAEALHSINFSETLLQGVLCFLLFAGALHIDIGDFLEQKWSIGFLASLGVVISAFIIGVGAYVLFPLFGFTLPFLVCFLFGALISPTDPVATLAILKNSKAPTSIKMKIAGESLLNDGMAVVLFVVALTLLNNEKSVSSMDVVVMFVQEVLGGIAYGLAIGYIAYELIRRVDDYNVEILLSLSLVTGGYALASVLHVSGPLAMAVAGLFIGNHARKYGMSEKTRKHLDIFWNVIDDVLNVILFVLVGLEALLINVEHEYALAGLFIIPLVLCARFISVSAGAVLLRPLKPFSPNSIPLLTWGGLRGGISFALALSLPYGEGRDALILITYMVVVFSVIAQGLTMNKIFAYLEGKNSVS
ncbi:MAG: sodium:proton antiporter [Parcubacteria group bacterium]|nr:sodium:proton antiporter [Parcubacteria group bacterium]